MGSGFRLPTSLSEVSPFFSMHNHSPPRKSLAGAARLWLPHGCCPPAPLRVTSLGRRSASAQGPAPSGPGRVRRMDVGQRTKQRGLTVSPPLPFSTFRPSRPTPVQLTTAVLRSVCSGWGGLRQLVREALGAELCKAEQCSRWARRRRRSFRSTCWSWRCDLVRVVRTIWLGRRGNLRLFATWF